MILLTIANIIYIFMWWISNWNILWPIKMLTEGVFDDKAIAHRLNTLVDCSSIGFTLNRKIEAM